MRGLRRSAVVFLFLLILSSVSRAQTVPSILTETDLSNVKIESYSDEDIKAMYDKAMETGLTETQLLKIAFDKGLPNDQIIKLRSRLEQMSGPGKNAGSDKDRNKDTRDDRDNNRDNNDRDNNNRAKRYDTSYNKAVPMENSFVDNSIFGSELFNKTSSVFEPNLRIATPAGYVLGPDDEILVTVFGYSEKLYNLKVNEEGNVYIPNVGPIYVSGLTIEQASEKIRVKLANTIYKALRSGQTRVQISLGRIRSIRVTVIGEAKKPGTYTVSSLTTLFNLLYLCGGPTQMGSYRGIQLVRGNDVKRTIDLYAFLLNGVQKDNVLLRDGDVVRIPYYKNRVVVTGNVKRQGKFEMADNESFSDLLEYCGGFNENAYKASVSVIRITDKERKMVDLSAAQFASFKANSGDEYFVTKLLENFENRVSITGAVSRPGPYEFTPGLTVKQLLEKAGGLKPEAYTKRATIFRYYKNRLPMATSVNLDSVMDHNLDFQLIKDDSISIHSIFEFREAYKVTVEGNVRKPGDVDWRENMTVRDVLMAAGGLTELGDSASIEVARRIKNANVGKVNHQQSTILTVNLANGKDPSGDVVLQPYDLVLVKALSGYTTQRTVLVVGEVKSPGKYTLQRSGDRISDVIRRIGGFKASADTTSITIRRNVQSNLSVAERERLFQRILNVNQDSLSSNDRLKNELYKSYDIISVNLADAMNHKNSAEDLVLQDGDVLTVNSNSNLVKVSGEVFYPTLLAYQPGNNLKYYIRQAGNFTPSARKTGVVVINPDGKAKSVRTFLFFKSYPKVTARSEIFVPQKTRSNRTKLGASELALIVSALGIIANVIITSRK